MERTVVRCAEGHLFSTGSLPMQNLGPERLGPGRLLRCPRCARLRSSVRVDPGTLSREQVEQVRRAGESAFV
ncbi:hypothetical protein ACFW9F_02820 [Streptomyces sp. NPDC059506]|uniref:hypothetical protein n=1 Tax=Streptomyces TaxID=1883 RepID=UPI000CBE3407|nr:MULTISPECIES: hypothetical protein [unclassified Streptomyces]MCZ2523737.1 hypothetical protein [Streptomyces sp. HB2AG]PLW71147.1 hypothetical protein C0036_19395 [Streptomyces sp. DJ]QMV22395.1 hypothetical protein GQS52_11985 [Streptomyces sp. SCUT-3]